MMMFPKVPPLRFIYKEKDECQIWEKAKKEAIKGRNILKEAKSDIDFQIDINGKYNLAVRDIQKESLPHPLPPLFQTLGMAAWAKSSCSAAKFQEKLSAAVSAPNPGKPAARIAAIEVALHHFLDDRPKEPVLSLEVHLIIRKESLEMMEQHPVEHGALRMSGAVDSCHSKES